MEFKGTYNPLGMQIEENIREAYENIFKELKQTNSLEESLELIKVMFEYLGKSRSEQGKGVDWARDIVEAYRTLGKIFEGVYSELETKLKKLEKEESSENLSELEELQKDAEIPEGDFD